jgi:hypothetical protein
MGNNSFKHQFDVEELKFCFITNSEGDILYSGFFDPTLKKEEKNFESLLKQLFKKEIEVSIQNILINPPRLRIFTNLKKNFKEKIQRIFISLQTTRMSKDWKN